MLTVGSFEMWWCFCHYVLTWFNVDPSGHICCTLISLYLAETQATGTNTLGKVFYCLLLVHSFLCLYYTAYVYHSVFESYLGLTVGLNIIFGCQMTLTPFADLVDEWVSKKWTNEVKKIIT